MAGADRVPFRQTVLYSLLHLPPVYGAMALRYAVFVMVPEVHMGVLMAVCGIPVEAAPAIRYVRIAMDKGTLY